MHSLSRSSHIARLIALGALIVVNIGLGAVLIYPDILSRLRDQIPRTTTGKFQAEEVRSVAEEFGRTGAKDFKDASEYFTKLAESRGAEFAYDVLKIAPIPDNVDMHLMGHVVGDVLYKQEGIEGMRICTQDFRNACSHSIVVGFLLEKGEGSIGEIDPICKKAPGGSGAYPMCFHGVGHGILAYVDYDMPRAVDLCKLASPPRIPRLLSECVSGAVMEILSGGNHDRKMWEKKSKIYAPISEPLLPCSASYMPAEARSECYAYLSVKLWKAVGADIKNPVPQNYTDAFPLCAKVPDRRDRLSCYGGFGKEFITIANSRDIRSVETMSNAEYQKIHDWCQLAKVSDGIDACTYTALSSLYWGGENHPDGAIRFCELLAPTPTKRQGCFEQLLALVANYKEGARVGLEETCALMPKDIRRLCEDRFLPTP